MLSLVLKSVCLFPGRNYIIAFFFFILITVYSLRDACLYSSFLDGNYILRKVDDGNLRFFIPFFRYKPSDLKEIMEATNAAVGLYTMLVGQKLDKPINVAIVEKTCSAGCSELGGERIEITSARFDRVVVAFKKSQEFDHLIFYELGRLFWLFDEELTCDNENLNYAMHTGFAIFMHCIVMQRLNIKVNKINGYRFDDYLSLNRKLIKKYEIEDGKTFENTIFVGRGITAEMSNSSNLFASMLFDLYDNCGKELFIRKFFQEIKKRNRANSEQEVINNLFVSACIATESDLTEKFLHDWKWPILQKTDSLENK